MSVGTFLATAYGPPWGGIQGTGRTATGIDLRGSPHEYIVAVDPNVIPLHTHLLITPNPFGDNSIVFRAEDTGGSIKGRRIDFYDWRGRTAQLAWGRRNVVVARTTAPGPRAGTGREQPAQGSGSAGTGMLVARPLYVNPLARAKVRGERIDQGVDYAGTGLLGAIAEAEITVVAVPAHGWPGNYLEYKITQSGVLEGVFVYYAEGVQPTVKRGDRVKAGDTVARLIPNWPSGIELGFAAGDGTNRTYFAYHDGPYSRYDGQNAATRPGIAFDNLVRRLGGPKGRQEGPVVGNFPEFIQSGEPPPSVTAAPSEGVAVPGYGGTYIAGQFDWPGSVLSAFVQLQRGALNASHHSHSAWAFTRDIEFIPKSEP